MSVNKIILLGNVGKDPEVRYLDSGLVVATTSLATTERGYTLENGTQVPERTEWHNLVFWKRQAEYVEKYVHKGDKLYIEGKIRTRFYDDHTGSKRYVTEVFVDVVELLTYKTATATTSQTTQQASPTQPQNIQPSPGVNDNPADDLPF